MKKYVSQLTFHRKQYHKCFTVILLSLSTILFKNFRVSELRQVTVLVPYFLQETNLVRESSRACNSIQWNKMQTNHHKPSLKLLTIVCSFPASSSLEARPQSWLLYVKMSASTTRQRFSSNPWKVTEQIHNCFFQFIGVSIAGKNEQSSHVERYYTMLSVLRRSVHYFCFLFVLGTASTSYG